MLQRLGVRGKILAVVAVPILVLVFAAGAVTFSAARQLDASQNVAQLLGVIRQAHDLVDNLQAERDAATNYTGIYRETLEQRETAWLGTDQAFLDILQAALDAPAAAQGSAQQASSEVAQLLQFRFDENGVLVSRVGAETEVTGGIYPLRAVDTQERVQDGTIASNFPTWPSVGEVEAVASNYASLRIEIAAILESLPAGTGLEDAIEVLLFATALEATSTDAFLKDSRLLEEAVAGTILAVNQAALVFVVQEGRMSPRDENANVLALTGAASSALDGIGEIRATLLDPSTNSGKVAGWYTAVVEDLIDLSYEVSTITADRQLSLMLVAYADSDTLIERIQVEKFTLEGIIRRGEFGFGEAQATNRLIVRTDLALVTAQESAATVEVLPAVPSFGASFDPTSTDVKSFEFVRNRLSTGQDSIAKIERVSNWPLRVSQELAVLAPLRDDAFRKGRAQSDEATAATLLQTILTSVIAAVVVVGSLFIALLISRRIVGPLRRLTTTATAVRQELPRLVERVALPGQTVDVSEVQIPVESADEIGRLAEAFNAVNAATLSIAGEQAALRGSISEMFVNVARRDQVLLNRQLASIDEMERTQDDAETLTRLFALDHLATRMRRNSESLLVLAGIDTGRRMRRAMPLSDVIRTASSEIELYERIQLELDADPAMVGHSSLTAAHLFAELLENATVFSDPGTPVVVRTIERDGNFIVEVIDRGIGMGTEELQEANQRVLSTAASEILGAQRLGLFVVGRIARRIGARVEIQSKEGEGTTTTVIMPVSLFDIDAEVDTKRTSESTVDENVHAPAALVEHRLDDQVLDVLEESSPYQEPQETVEPDPIEVAPFADVGVANADGGGGERIPVEEITIDQMPTEATVTTQDINHLIEADAILAPTSSEVDLASLTGGVTETGLPARRRGGPADTEAQPETSSILGLPARPTTGQMDEISSGDAPSGFVPQVSASEVAPQTAEQRASMFRGFQGRREEGEEGEEVILDPDAESLGQAARRGAVAPDSIPALEEEDSASIERGTHD